MEQRILSGDILTVEKDTGAVIPVDTKEYNTTKRISFRRFATNNFDLDPTLRGILGNQSLMRLHSLAPFVTDLGTIRLKEWQRETGIGDRAMRKLLTDLKKCGVVKKFVCQTQMRYHMNPFVITRKLDITDFLIDQFKGDTIKHLIPVEVLGMMLRDSK